MLSVLLKRNYALLWIATLVSGVGNSVNALSSLFGSLLAGVLADRFGGRLIICAGGGIWVIAGLIAIFALEPALRVTAGPRSAA